MPRDLAEVSVFTSPITVPENGEPARRETSDAPTQALANRTKFLDDARISHDGRITAVEAWDADNRLDDIEPRIVSDEWTYPTPKARTLIFGLGFPSFLFGTTAAGAPMWAVRDGGVTGPNCIPIVGDGEGERAKAWALLRLPNGATVTAVRVLFAKHTAHVTESDRWSARFEKLVNWDFSPAAAPGRSIIGALTYAASGGSGGSGTLVPDVIAWTGLSEVIDNPDTTYCVAVIGPALEGADDRLYGVEVTFNDPGPRNF